MKIHDSIKILVDIGVWDDFVNAMKIQSINTQRAIREMTNSNTRADTIIGGYLHWRATSQGYIFWNEKACIARRMDCEKTISNES